MTADNVTLPPRPAPLAILLVEDSRAIAERLAELISGTPGMNLLCTVDSERQALATIAAEHVDVIVLDLHLREGTGFGVLRAMAAKPAPAPAIIVLTNYDLPEYRRAVTSLGAMAFLDKVRDFDRLPVLLQEISAARFPA